MVNIAML